MELQADDLGVLLVWRVWEVVVRTAACCAPPGSVAKQRNNAVVYDPYTDNEIGPEVVGGRPKDYQKPLSETERSRLMQRNKSLY